MKETTTTKFDSQIEVKLTDSPETSINKPLTALTIQTWLISYLAELLNIEKSEIDVNVNYDRYGLDSAAAAVMMGDLDEWLEHELDPTLVYDYPTVKLLAQHLAEEMQTRA